MGNYRLAAFADEADGSVDGQIRAMLKNGVSMLEIRGVDGSNISDITVEKAKEVRNKLDAAGLGVWSLGSPYGKIGITEDFKPHLEKFRRGLEIADVLGAKNIRMFSFYVDPKYPEAAKDEVFERLGQFVEAAKGSDVILCHENEKGIYGDIASRCRKIHEAFPSIRGVFDPANYIQCGQDTKEAWEMLAPYIHYMHIKDALASGAVVPAGKGIGQLPYLLSRFKEGVLTLEPHLSVFPGFASLETEKKTQMGTFVYENSNDAFDAAVNALKALI